jgi:hypothetical protein
MLLANLLKVGYVVALWVNFFFLDEPLEFVPLCPGSGDLVVLSQKMFL